MSKTEALEQSRDAFRALLANIRRDAPQLSGKAMGYAELAIDAINAALAEPEVPKGMVLVPIEPNPAMLFAGAREWGRGTAGDIESRTWKAMLAAAAPSPQEQA